MLYYTTNSHIKDSHIKDLGLSDQVYDQGDNTTTQRFLLEGLVVWRTISTEKDRRGS